MNMLAAYQGPPLSLKHFLEKPRAAWLANVHGFGVGWYAPDGLPAVYGGAISPLMDANLPGLARGLSSGLWLLHAQDIPAEAPRAPVIQPVHDEDFMFACSGGIDMFRLTVCPRIRHFLAPRIEAEIMGTGAAEYLFAVLRHLFEDDDDLSIDQALSWMFTLLNGWVGSGAALLNIVISDGEALYAARHAINADCAPLYYTTDDEAYPNGQLISTEPLTASEFWQPVPKHHVLILDPEQPPELIAL